MPVAGPLPFRMRTLSCHSGTRPLPPGWAAGRSNRMRRGEGAYADRPQAMASGLPVQAVQVQNGQSDSGASYGRGPEAAPGAQAPETTNAFAIWRLARST